MRSTAADHLLSPLFLLDLELLLECDESPVFNRLRDLCPVEFSRWSESESDPTSKPLLLEERRRPFVFPSSPVVALSKMRTAKVQYESIQGFSDIWKNTHSYNFTDLKLIIWANQFATLSWNEEKWLWRRYYRNTIGVQDQFHSKGGGGTEVLLLEYFF